MKKNDIPRRNRPADRLSFWQFLAVLAVFDIFWQFFLPVFRILVFWYSIQTGFLFVDMSGFAFWFKTASFWHPER